MKGVQAQHRLGCPLGGHGVDPLRAVGGDVGQQRGCGLRPGSRRNAAGSRSHGPWRPTPTGRCHDRPRRANTGGPCGRKSRRPRSGATRRTGRAAPLVAATTRMMTAATERQVIRSSAASTVNAAWQASHATVSSKALVNRDPCRAQGTAATTTPWVATVHPGRRCLQIHPGRARRPGPATGAARHRGHTAARAGHTAHTDPAATGWDAPWRPARPRRPTASSSTFSITVCCTPSTDRHTLTARNAVS